MTVVTMPAHMLPFPHLPLIQHDSTIGTLPSTPPLKTSEPFPIARYELAADPDTEIARAMRNVAAEDARCRRILPNPPLGHAWKPEIQVSSDVGFRGVETRVRIVYRLIEVL